MLKLKSFSKESKSQIWMKDRKYVNFIKSFFNGLVLDVGCGYNKMGNIGVDIIKNDFVDVIHDLNNTPYPFKDNSFLTINCHHVIEHLNSPEKVLQELHKILKPNGKIVITVPHANHPMYLSSEHKQFFDKKSMTNLMSKYFKIIEIIKWRGTERMPFPVFIHKIIGMIYPSQLIFIGQKSK